MKKSFITLFICVATIIMCSSMGYAKDAVVETPYVKVVIDGKLTKYKDVPIQVNDRTMLPLRELLTNLGVQNDDGHIIWNEGEQSVTVIKDTKKIFLKVNSENATVDGASIKLDVAPIKYKNRVYIPARFISQSLGKKIAWDGSTTTVLIRDQAEFDKIEEILKKSDTAMKAVNKVNFKFDMGMKASENSLPVEMNISAAGKIDKKNKLMHMQMEMAMMGISFAAESYLADYVQYQKNPLNGRWEKEDVSKLEYDKEFSKGDVTELFEDYETLGCGLVLKENLASDELILDGNVFLNELYSKVSQNADGDESFTMQDFNLQMIIDKKTYHLKKIVISFRGVPEDGEQNEAASFNATVAYSDYDGNFEIKVPEEVIKGAVKAEAKDSFLNEDE